MSYKGQEGQYSDYRNFAGKFAVKLSSDVFTVYAHDTVPHVQYDCVIGCILSSWMESRLKAGSFRYFNAVDDFL